MKIVSIVVVLLFLVGCSNLSGVSPGEGQRYHPNFSEGTTGGPVEKSEGDGENGEGDGENGEGDNG